MKRSNTACGKFAILVSYLKTLECKDSVVFFLLNREPCINIVCTWFVELMKNGFKVLGVFYVRLVVLFIFREMKL